MRETPETFMAKHEAALNARDLDAARELIAEDTVFLLSNQTNSSWPGTNPESH